MMTRYHDPQIAPGVSFHRQTYDLFAALRPNEKPEDENMGNKQGWHDGGWDEECAPQFSRINLKP
jgi:hypothetical protein